MPKSLALVALLACAVSAQIPRIVAHRGASLHLPEHTLAAYTLAIAQGADLIEPDVVLTRDGVPLCLHDVHLERVTDVETVFPERKRPDGRYYAIDFDLEELRVLEVDLDGAGGQGHRLATLDEMLALVRRLEKTLDRAVGVIPEPKAPGFHARAGRDLVGAVVACLARHGFRTGADGVVLQCFELDALAALRERGTGLPLVWLVGERPSDDEMARAGRICQGLGPRKTLVTGAEGRSFRSLARRHDLELWPWTFQADEKEMRSVLEMPEVAGIFTDAPAAGVRARAALTAAVR